MPELDRGGGGLFAPPYKIGSQNTPYKLGLNYDTLFSSTFFCRWGGGGTEHASIKHLNKYKQNEGGQACSSSA